MNNISRYIAITAGILILATIVYFFSNIVAYVLIAWVLAMIGQPLMILFQKRIRIGRFRAGPTTAAILTIICYFIFFTFLIWLFVPLIVQQARNLVGVDYNAIAQALEEPIAQLNAWGRRFGFVLPNDTAEEQIKRTLSGWFEPTQISNFFGLLVGMAGNFLFTLFSVVFITFFFLKEQGLFVNFLAALLPNEYENQVRNSVDDASRLLTRYFGGILIQMTIITIFVSVLLKLLGLKNALLIGFFAALINVIPYLGPIIGAAFGIFITISSNLSLEFYSEMLPLLLQVIAVFAAMQLLDNFVLQPYIFSNSVLAHPLEIFIIILMGAQLNDIVGMVLAIPVYTVFRVIARAFLSEFKIVQKLTERMKTP